MSDKLRAAVERLFSADFVFDKDHRAWRSVVADDDGTPLPVDLHQLGTFSDVARLTSSVPAVMVAEIATAVKDSAVVELRPNPAGSAPGFAVVRRERLDVKHSDPDLRTVFAKPIHFDALDEEIVAFFSRWGKVEKVERRQYLAGSAGTEKVRPSTFIVFSTIEEARACVAAKPSYGRAEVPLAQLWIPQLVVMMKESHERAQAELLQRGAALAKQQAISSSDATKDDADNGNDGFETNKYLRPRCTCKVWDISPANAASSWQNIKAKLGNLSISFPTLKKKIGMVHSNGTCAYVVCKTPETAQTLLTAYATLLGGEKTKVADELREAVPRLTLLDGAEEEEFIRVYPGIVSALTQKKLVANAKRPRD